jgi:hypothetical protein
MLNAHGTFTDPFSALNVRRPAQEGAKDVGDVWAVPFVLECKNVSNPSVPSFLRQARTEAGHAGFPYGVAVVKTRGRSVMRGLVHFDVRTWTRVRLALGLSTVEMRREYRFAPTVRSRNTGWWYLTCDVHQFSFLLEDLRKVMGH